MINVIDIETILQDISKCLRAVLSVILKAIFKVI